METYAQFLQRINSFEKKVLSLGDGKFECNRSLVQKVRKDNSFGDFYGDTVVFALDDAVKRRLSGYVDRLYAAAPHCFCERLLPHTFHVTLHDLGNSPSLCDVAEELFYNELKAVEAKDAVSKLGINKIRLKSKCIFNMVNTSLVLGLYPADERNYLNLMSLYSVFDGIKMLGYPLTPHITLAYYNVNGFDAADARALENIVNSINAEDETTVEVDSLFYQKFRSMNDYIDIVKLL